MSKPDRNDYDTITGIARSLKHYPHFHAMLEARKNAYREREEPLNSFVVLSAFTLDQFGQLGKLVPSPRGVLKGIPDVMDVRDFYERLKSTPLAGTGLSNVLAPVYLPPLNTRCAGCGKYYGVEDCQDAVISRKGDIHLELDNFLGKQLWEVRRHLRDNHSVYRYIHPSSIIHNDRFIDKRTEPYFDSTSPINGHGWVGVEDGITDAYVIQPGDATQFDETQYFHKDCFVPWMTERTKVEFEDVLTKVGFQKFTMVSTQNEYGSFQYHGPWFVVGTPEGRFTIGWRKRVIQITLHDWPVDLCSLFGSENVTVDRQLVHAWNHEKAVEYLKAILAVMVKEPA